MKKRKSIVKKKIQFFNLSDFQIQKNVIFVGE